jgi:hypothetical protein
MAVTAPPALRPDAPDRVPEVESSAPGGTPRPRRRRWLRRALVVVALYLVVCGGVAVLGAFFAYQGISELRAVRADLGPAELLDGTAQRRLADAEADLDRASTLIGGPWFAPLHLVPGLGRQVEAVQSMVVGSAGITAAAVDGLADAHRVLGDGVPSGPGRVTALRDLADVADGAAADLAAVDAGPQTWLLPGLGAVAADFAQQKDGLEESLLRSRDASRALATVLDGPSTYLLFAANNAEMRAGSGMLLSAGLLRAHDGNLDVTDLDPVAEMILAEGVGITDPDIEALWGFSAPDQDFRNLLLSPRFGPNAEMAARMWEALGRPHVDGVLSVDVLALEDLLEAVGPVNIAGEQIDHTNVRDLLLHDQYTRVSQDHEGQDARRDVLGPVARAVLERFDVAEPDPGALARALQDSATGRHLMLWSADQELEQAWRGVGVAGELEPDGVLVSILNDGNNKLDPFLDVRARLTPTDATHGTLRLRVTNTVGPDELPYISGADPEAVGGYGIYPGRLAANFPSGTELTVVAGPEIQEAGSDGASEVVTGAVRIDPGATVVWEVAYVLGQPLDQLRILPSARAPGIEWRAGGRSWNGLEHPGRTIDLP